MRRIEPVKSTEIVVHRINTLAKGTLEYIQSYSIITSKPHAYTRKETRHKDILFMSRVCVDHVSRSICTSRVKFHVTLHTCGVVFHTRGHFTLVAFHIEISLRVYGIVPACWPIWPTDSQNNPDVTHMLKCSLDTTCFKAAWDNKLVSLQWYFSAFIRSKIYSLSYQMPNITLFYKEHVISGRRVISRYFSLRIRPTWLLKKWPNDPDCPGHSTHLQPWCYSQLAITTIIR